MNSSEKRPVKVAILDLYEGVANQGMRCIRDILKQYGEANFLDVMRDEFEVRQKQEVPGTGYDIYIATGGPGSPLDSRGSSWEKAFFRWLSEIEAWNNDAGHVHKKYVFFICHSFQLVCRHYRLAEVSKRKSTAFGVFPVHMLPGGREDVVFEGLNDPFYAVDSRDYQVTQPNYKRLEAMRSSLLCIEKERPHVALERAIMGIRFNEFMIGTQFHPEADAIGMSMYFQQEDKKNSVIAAHGEAKWTSMIEQLNDPDKILWTYSHVLPNFLNQAVEHLQTAEV
ncbi:MAG: GMP synthase [Chitinophagaceae bacterium]|nr:GMP synthase [Chitinophagaceae bacterium]